MENFKYNVGTYNPKVGFNQMTLIIGAKCKDGVVLIGDKRVIEGGDVTTDDKITLLPELGVGFSGAGLKELFDKFLTRTFINLDERKKKIRETMLEKNPEADTNAPINPYTYGNEFVEDCERIMSKMKQDYPSVMQQYPNQLHILIAFRIREAELHSMHIFDCFDSQRNTFIAIGSGSPYAQTFLKELWNENITMREMARLGCFIINYVEQTKLDNAVGDGVQVLYVPNIDEQYDAWTEELLSGGDKQNIENFKEYVDEINKKISDKYSIRFEHDTKNIFPATQEAINQFKQSFKALEKKIKEQTTLVKG